MLPQVIELHTFRDEATSVYQSQRAKSQEVCRAALLCLFNSREDTDLTLFSEMTSL
ncbi:hypothetical protein EXN66_Car013719 [Channa argus]|uniref:Uncharacterized protein n=1 Tax=Channa argus TaxID=215402 RepID=A0A6G1Q6Z8_CHAAH|nr:hypothetical protein EXN66_Car013719 [Channa argus]